MAARKRKGSGKRRIRKPSKFQSLLMNDPEKGRAIFKKWAEQDRRHNSK